MEDSVACFWRHRVGCQLQEDVCRSELRQSRDRHQLRAKDFPRCCKIRLLSILFIPLDLFENLVLLLKYLQVKKDVVEGTCN